MLLLGGEFRGIIKMLILATATDAEMRADWLRSTRSWSHEFHKFSTCVVFADFNDFDDRLVTDGGQGDEYDAVRRTGDPFSAKGQIRKGNSKFGANRKH